MDDLTLGVLIGMVAVLVMQAFYIFIYPGDR